MFQLYLNRLCNRADTAFFVKMSVRDLKIERRLYLISGFNVLVEFAVFSVSIVHIVYNKLKPEQNGKGGIQMGPGIIKKPEGKHDHRKACAHDNCCLNTGSDGR